MRSCNNKCNTWNNNANIVIFEQDNVSQLDKTGALTVSGPFLDYFLNAFKYRQIMHERVEDEKSLNAFQVDVVEDKLIETFLALALKLPLDDFKPMFYRLFNLSMVS